MEGKKEDGETNKEVKKKHEKERKLKEGQRGQIRREKKTKEERWRR